MDRSHIYYLVGRYLEKHLNATEAAEFQLILKDPAYAEQLQAAFESQAAELDMNVNQDAALLPILQSALDSDKPAISGSPVHRVHFLRKWSWVAASIILLIGVTILLVVSSDQPVDRSKTASVGIAPGKNGAMLTLADGSQVSLDSIQNGVVALQGGATAKVVNGILQYEGSGSEVVYNTMSTPKGRQFQVTLPDGTQVWLNAASSIRYPTVFTGHDRRVEVTGEAYFEVAKNTKMPFRLRINNKAAVEVLGTHFNVNAYENEESINTTLIEGSIAVALSSDKPQQQTRPVILKPGQQAQLQVGQKTLKILNNADIDKVMAWRNGLFIFEGATLEEIMKQLERWYDIEVVYEKGIPKLELAGKITRDVSLHELLTGLKDLGMNYKLEGRRLIVMP